MAVVTPTQSSLRLLLNAGTSASGSPIIKRMNLFSSAKLKTSLDNAALDAGMAIIGLLGPCLINTVRDVEYVSTSTVSAV